MSRMGPTSKEDLHATARVPLAQIGPCLPLPKSPTLPKLLPHPDLSYITPGTFCFSLTHVIPVPQ